MSNKDFYESKIAEKRYDNIDLQKPELAILCKFEDKLPSMKMLDIGVGGGRTTYYFAELAKEYHGIDYSERLIDMCKRKFKKYIFNVCDVRDMRIYDNEYFDLILFSYNGIDSMAHDDRLIALKEIRRVCKKNGVFIFSTKNLQYLDQLFSIERSKDPVRIVYSVYYNTMLKLKNKPLNYLKKFNHVVIHDGKPNFNFDAYYIKPIEQLIQLKDVGFNKVKIFSLFNGREIKNLDDLDKNKDWWLYYWCEA